MDAYYEKLLINVFTTTCHIPETKMTFSQFYNTYYETILNYFHIDSPTAQEIDLIYDVLIGTRNEYTNLKFIIYQMSLNDQYKFGDIENFAFQAICPIIVSASKRYRQLESYRKMSGIVTIPLEDLVIPYDLRGFSGSYFIIPYMNGYNIYDRHLEMVAFFGSPFEASDYCENREFQIKILKISGCLLTVGILGYIVKTCFY